jgi:transposase
MQSISTIGLDIAKSVFQVHGVDAAGQVVVRRQLRRRHVLAFFQKLPPCLVGIEACASSHHWSRELQALGVNQKSGTFTPEKFEDHYETALVDIINQKRAGKPITAKERPRGNNVVDLLEALHRSVGSAAAETEGSKK